MDYLFTNNTQVKLDERGRFAVALVDFDQLRHGNEVAEVYVALGKDRQLEIWPADAFRDKARQLKEKAQSDPRWLLALRRFTANAKSVQIDKQRRVALPIELRTAAGIEALKEVVVNGLYDHIEIWLPESYNETDDGSDLDL